jgi:hypothetical protein
VRPGLARRERSSAALSPACVETEACCQSS